MSGTYGLVPMTSSRKEFGHRWMWVEPNVCIRGHYRSTSGNLVMVFPEDGQTSDWVILIDDDEIYTFSGENAEMRAFASAATFVSQDRN